SAVAVFADQLFAAPEYPPAGQEGKQRRRAYHGDFDKIPRVVQPLHLPREKIRVRLQTAVFDRKIERPKTRHAEGALQLECVQVTDEGLLECVEVLLSVQVPEIAALPKLISFGIPVL